MYLIIPVFVGIEAFLSSYQNVMIIVNIFDIYIGRFSFCVYTYFFSNDIFKRCEICIYFKCIRSFYKYILLSYSFSDNYKYVSNWRGWKQIILDIDHNGGILMSKEQNVINYYVLCNKLKNVIRTG